MSLKWISSCILATWLLTTVGAITVSIDRSDIKTSPTRSSMIANGWRPLANGYEDAINTNTKSTNHPERNVQPHPVLNKFQEHMIKSEKLKSQRNKNKQNPSSNQDYSPPTILGSFTVFGNAAAKARGEGQKVSQQGHGNNKYVASETRDYTFLIPPPKDVYRFEHPEPPRKVVRDNSYSIVNDFLRQPAYVPPQVHQIIPDAVRAATYFIKGYTSTTNPAPSTPPKNNRPPTSYFNGYSNGVPQLLQPPRQQAKPFESLKIIGNAKPYLQPPGTEPGEDFGKDDGIVEQKRHPSYERYQPQIHASNGNFYAQVNHPTNHYKTSYERNPAYLVHESHEVSYVTPSSIYNEYNFRPSVSYDTLLPSEVYSTSMIDMSSTTAAPQIHNQSLKYVHSNDVIREENYYKNPHIVSSTVKQNDNHGNILSTSVIPNTYYVSEQQDLTPPPASWPLSKNKYPSDINEVLPRVNPPNKFAPDVIQPSQLPLLPSMVYVNPQVHQYQSSIVPSQQHDYETPESISLKHFNEQQFIIQQQLVHRDRERLAEQEHQQQMEIKRQQQEELKKHQEELEKLIKQDKEEENNSSVERNITDHIEFAKINNSERPYTTELPQYEIPMVISQSPIIYNEQNTFKERTKSHGSQIQQPKVGSLLKTSFENQKYQTQFNQEQQTNYNKESSNYQKVLNNQQQEYVNYQEPELQSHRQQKPSRDQYRRKKPGVANTSERGHENIITTDIPIHSPETLIPSTFSLEEISIHTTVSPEPTTFPNSQSITQRSRTRKPGLSSQRRRRPSTTTPEPITLIKGEYYEKYEDIQEEQLDPIKRRRIKPTYETYQETYFERRPNIRKRPGNRIRVNHGEPYEAEIVTEIIQTPVNAYKGNSEHREKYLEDNKHMSNLSNNQYFDYTSVGSQYTDDDRRNYTTEIIQSEYSTELTKIDNFEESQDIILDHNHRMKTNIGTNIPLEDLFVKTDGYYFEKDITTLPTATTGIKTTTTAPTTTAAVTTSTTRRSTNTMTNTPPTTTPIPPPSPPSPPSPPPTSSSSLSTTTSIVKLVTQASHVSPAPSRLRVRPMRFGNTTRPRFSIKDYHSRIDYKNKFSTTTESIQTVQSKPKLFTFKPQQIDEHVGNRETTGRYKYMSKTSQRTATVTSANEPENKVEIEHNPSSSTTSTERSINRFVPKRRPSSGNFYRSKISVTAGNRSQQQQEQQQQQQQGNSKNHSKYSTVRSENIFSSSVRRKPINKHRRLVYKEFSTLDHHASISNHTDNSNNQEALTAEITAEETSFYIPAATTSGESETSNHSLKSNEENVSNRQKLNLMDNRKGQNDTIQRSGTSYTQETEKAILDKEKESRNFVEEQLECTTSFDVPSEEEELLTKVSQSVADLTSSASALYDKPGIFKTFSPESRVISPQFKISTDEPTLPIEAFFQELSKKN
ncbi:putative mediator of RNA polymerase II transcription subunit 26 [Vespula pensylvanica]|uniref:putative mediator of RNA polymerase II transcription subunit 26 n=1 Tax=Vespula pensylvanica TaxID=30213 RepID=UPI001CBA278A|nr:putative mediator of RNA polymerase II transcription subunit 26 [Vespula pensylvanica]